MRVSYIYSYLYFFEVTKEGKYRDKAIDILNKEKRLGRMSVDAFRIFADQRTLRTRKKAEEIP